MLVPTAAPAGSVLEGHWRNPNGTVIIAIAPCGEVLCGRVQWASEKAMADARKGGTDPLVGAELLREIVPNGDGRWKARLFVPDLNKTSKAELRESAPRPTQGDRLCCGPSAMQIANLDPDRSALDTSSAPTGPMIAQISVATERPQSSLRGPSVRRARSLRSRTPRYDQSLWCNRAPRYACSPRASALLRHFPGGRNRPGSGAAQLAAARPCSAPLAPQLPLPARLQTPPWRRACCSVPRPQQSKRVRRAGCWRISGWIGK